MARCIWVLDKGDLVNRMIIAREPRNENWIFALMETLHHAEFVRLTVTLWSIWAARRKFIHEGITQSPHSTHLSIQRFIAKLDLLHEGKPRILQPSPQEIHLAHARLKAPLTGFAKIHVDGVVLWYRGGFAAVVCQDE